MSLVPPAAREFRLGGVAEDAIDEHVMVVGFLGSGAMCVVGASALRHFVVVIDTVSRSCTIS